MKFTVNVSTTNGEELFYDTSFPFDDLSIISPVLSLEDSNAGSFEFTMPKGHAYYSTLERFKTKVIIYRNDSALPYWEGRVLSESTDFYNQRNVYCEGALSYLNDTHQPQHEYHGATAAQLVEAILNCHNDKVDKSRWIFVGTVPIQWDDENNEYFYTQYESTLSSITKLAERMKYHIRISFAVVTHNGDNDPWNTVVARYGSRGLRVGDVVKVIDMFKDISTDSLQQIIFGENLLDFTRNYDMSNLVTALLPLGNAGSKSTNHQLGNDITDTYYTGGMSEGWCFYLGTDANNVKFLATTNVYPNVENPSSLPLSIQTRKYLVNPGTKYFLTSTLPSGYDMIYHVLVYSNGTVLPSYHYTEVKTTSGSGGDETITETLIEVPRAGEGVTVPTELWISGDVAQGALKLYECKVLPDEFEDYITIESVNNGSMYVTAQARDITYYDEDGEAHTVSFDPVTEYGYIEKSLTVDIPESKCESQEMAANYVKDTAIKYLEEYQFDNLSLAVSAVDMNALGVNISCIDMYTKVRVISAVHGLNALFPVTKIRYSLDNLAQTQYDLGSKEERTLTAVNDAIDSELLAKIAETPSTSSVLQAAKNQAAKIVNGASEGYVTMIQSDDKTHTTAMTISGIPWEQNPTNYWMFNKDGWVYMNNGDPKTAADMDGTIYADLITAGTMFAERIKGGQLTLGDYGDGITANGSILVRDGSTPPKKLLQVDVNGLTSRSTIVPTECNIAQGKVAFIRDADSLNPILSSAIDGNTTYRLEEGGPVEYGLDVNGNIVCLNSNTLLVTDHRDGQIMEAVDTSFTINNTTYTFHHGILVSATHEEPQEESLEGGNQSEQYYSPIEPEPSEEEPEEETQNENQTEEEEE